MKDNLDRTIMRIIMITAIVIGFIAVGLSGVLDNDDECIVNDDSNIKCTRMME